jgi:polyphosphate kinase
MKQTLYRTTRIRRLRARCWSGIKKEVTVVVELKASFTKLRTRWARSRRAGVQVFHGLVGLKRTPSSLLWCDKMRRENRR